MRRKDREIHDQREIIQIMESCDVCRLALNDEEYPYIVPLNFGIEVENGRIVLYFHGAKEGKKLELMAKDSRASFQMDCAHRFIPAEEKCGCTMEYQCVMGHGRVEMVLEEEKYQALSSLLKHYHQDASPMNPVMIKQTAVWKLVVQEVSGKALRKKIVQKVSE